MKITSLNDIPFSEVSHNQNIKKQVMIQSAEINKITNFSRATFPPGECAPAHSHNDMTEVFFIVSGSGEIRINQKNYSLTTGNCITVEPGESHELVNSGETDMVVIYFGIESD